MFTKISISRNAIKIQIRDHSFYLLNLNSSTYASGEQVVFVVFPETVFIFASLNSFTFDKLIEIFT